MKYSLLAFLLACAIVAGAQQKVVRLYPGKAPGSEKWYWQESISSNNLFQTPVVYNVADPTLTVYLPDPALANGTAVVVCPGGAFHTLSIDSEGSEVAKWLNKKGIAAFVLKYRVVRSLTDDPVKELLPKMQNIPKLDAENDSVVTMAIADGKRAVEWVRGNAAAYNLNPNRIGLMGFSAGGTVTMGVGYSYTAANRPDFLAPVYYYAGALKKQAVPKDAPPIFICAASDDQLGFATHSSSLYNEWIAAAKSAELHMYVKGGHGFGMRKQNLPVDSWIERFGEWLDFQGFTKKQN